MYIYDPVPRSTGEENRVQIARLDEFLATGPQQVQTLYRARLQNLLAEAKGNSLLCGSTTPEMAERRQRMLQYRRRGACKKFELPGGGGELISCILWDGEYYITGTDIIKVILFQLRLEGIHVSSDAIKKFEEGIFSDLRYLKSGRGARLEEARSEFLEWLCRHGCIRTQKKQKVYHWEAVDISKLVQDARDRYHRRHEMIDSFSKAVNLSSHLIGYSSSIPPPPRPSSCSSSSLGILEEPVKDVFLNNLTDGNMNDQRDFYTGLGSSFLLNDLDTLTTNAPGIASPSNCSITSGVEFMDLTDFNLHFFGLDPSSDSQFYPEGGIASSTSFDSQENLSVATKCPKNSQPLSDALLPSAQLGRVPILPSSILNPPIQCSPRLLPVNPATPRPPRRDEERRFVCNYQFCKRRFKRLEHLKRHVRIHTGERPFPCPVEACGKSFSRSDNLAQHLKIHMAHELSAATTETIGIFRALATHQHQKQQQQQQQQQHSIQPQLQNEHDQILNNASELFVVANQISDGPKLESKHQL